MDIYEIDFSLSSSSMIGSTPGDTSSSVDKWRISTIV